MPPGPHPNLIYQSRSQLLCTWCRLATVCLRLCIDEKKKEEEEEEEDEEEEGMGGAGGGS